MKPSFMSRILLCALYGIFAAGLIGAGTLPILIDRYVRWFYGGVTLDDAYRTFLLVFLMVVALPGLWIIGEMIGMMRSISHNPFVKRNVRALCRCGALLFLIAGLFLVKCFFYFTFLTMACTFLFLICGFFAFTLADLFRRAVSFKEENDLTI